ncbi:hypothetical protein Pfo_030285 [Paulownia fortunei]|nr:hypothetical protein Pfo_030285 [Paulownia fortunei]
MRRGCTVKSLENHYSVMNRIMLRFRPIAPKPAGAEAVSDALEQERRNGAFKNGRRTKRKYVRVRGRQSTKRKTRECRRSSPPEKSGIDDDSSSEKVVVTLPLLPERSESDKCCYNSTAQKIQENWDADQYKVDDQVNYKKVDSGGGHGTEALGSVRSVMKTWIIVECVTDTFIDSGVGLGYSDREKINNLQVDTCPGFVSDGTNNVVWVNEAYRKMVAENGLLVWLVVKEQLPHYSPSFACRARMIQQTKHGHKWNRIVACDVWRMEFAGFAWKLDVSTALGLGI